MSCVFYPTGYVFALFPAADLARQAENACVSNGYSGKSAYASPEVIQKDIVRTLGGSDPLPSVGAEGDIVRRIADLASTGHHGLLVEVGKHDDADSLKANLLLRPSEVISDFNTYPMVKDQFLQTSAGRIYRSSRRGGGVLLPHLDHRRPD